MTTQPILHLVAGDGVVARRSTELLFVPTGSTSLLDVFREAEPGDGLDAVTEFCEAQDFEADEFVALDWSSGLKVAAFGDVELTSNQKSLPRLSGAGAGTWVERSLRKIDGPIEIGVSIAERIETTDLVEGRAQAGGFVLILDELPEPTPTPQQQSPFRVAESLDSSPESAAEPVVDKTLPEISVSGSSDATSIAAGLIDVSDSDRPEEPVTSHFVAPESAPPIDEDGDAGPEATKVADDLLGVLSGGTETSNPYAVGPEDDTVVPTPEMRSMVDSLVSAGVSDDATSAESGPRWQLRIVEGGIEAVDRDLILGRKPQLAEDDGPDGARLVPLVGTHLSRSHLRVGLRNGAIFLTDLGSKNGSFIVTTGDGQLVQLEAHSERRVDAGTIVQTGSVRFFVESRADS